MAARLRADDMDCVRKTISSLRSIVQFDALKGMHANNIPKVKTN